MPVYNPPAAGGGVSDHGALDGLADDDHTAYATNAELTTHDADTTAVHGLADTAVLATDAEVATAVSDHAAAANPHTVYALDTDLSAHEADTTSVHGIADTSVLLTTTHTAAADPHTGYVLESLVDAKGDLIVASAADTVARLAVGTNDHVLTADSGQATGVKWAAAPSGSGIPATLLDAKGDLIAASAADTAARLAVGTNGHVLTADSAESTGIKWAAPGSSVVPHGRGVNNAGAIRYMVPGVELTTMSTNAPGANVTTYSPIYVATAITVDLLAVEVSTLTAGTARLGIYEADTDWQPTDLVIDAGTVDTGSTGVKSIAVSQVLPAGRYLSTVYCSSGFTLRVAKGGTMFMGMVTALGASPFSAQFTVAGSITSLPDPGTEWTTAAGGNATPFGHTLFYRISVP